MKLMHMFEPRRRVDLRKKKYKRPCIAKRSLSTKKMLYSISFNSSGPVVQMPGQFYNNSVLKKERRFTITSAQAMDGQS
jgi:hypothetical protein